MRRLTVTVGFLCAALLIVSITPVRAQVSGRSAIGASGSGPGGPAAAPVDIEALKQRAGTGDVAAQSELGNRYFWGTAGCRGTGEAGGWLVPEAKARRC